MPAAKQVKPLRKRGEKKNEAAERTCEVINRRFAGNLSTAAEATGINYHRLRRVCLGRWRPHQRLAALNIVQEVQLWDATHASS